MHQEAQTAQWSCLQPPSPHRPDSDRCCSLRLQPLNIPSRWWTAGYRQLRPCLLLKLSGGGHENTAQKEKRPTLWVVSQTFTVDVKEDLNDASLFNQTGSNPVLGLGAGAAFSDLDHITQLIGARFIMSMVLARLAHDLAVELVLHTTLDQHGHGLGTLCADNLADQGALEGFFSFRHVGPLLGGLLFSKNGLGASDVTTGRAQGRSVVQLLRGFLHTQTEVGLLQGLHFSFEAGNVFLAQFSSFRHFDFS